MNAAARSGLGCSGWIVIRGLVGGAVVISTFGVEGAKAQFMVGQSSQNWANGSTSQTTATLSVPADVVARQLDSIEAQRARMENKMLKGELEAFGRLNNGLAIDERQARQMRENLERHRKELMKFLNGVSGPLTRASFLRSMQQLEQTPQMQQLLQCQVPLLGHSDFASESLAFSILEPDGSLVNPPPALLSDEPRHALAATREQFNSLWSQTVEDLGEDRPVTAPRVSALRQALAEWKQAAESVLGKGLSDGKQGAEPALATASCAARSAAQSYLKSVGCLLDSLNDRPRRQRLTRYVKAGGFGFPGGTVADLIRHVRENNLSLSYGGRAQLVVGELGHDLVRDLDDQIALLDKRIEYFKAQNPAHNSALKERLIAQSQRANAAPLVPPISGTGSAYTTPSASSQFTYSPGDQPAGLMSQAYSKPSPQLNDGHRPARPNTSAANLPSVAPPRPAQQIGQGGSRADTLLTSNPPQPGVPGAGTFQATPRRPKWFGTIQWLGLNQ